MPLPNLQRLNDIYSRVTTSQHTYDLDAILHIHQASLRQTQQTNWIVIPLTSLATIITLSILMYFLCNRFRNTYCISCKTNATTSPSQPTIEPSKPHNEASTSSDENTSSNVLFSSYALRQSQWYRCKHSARHTGWEDTKMRWIALFARDWNWYLQRCHMQIRSNALTCCNIFIFTLYVITVFILEIYYVTLLLEL